MARPAEAIQQFSLRSVAFFLPFTMTFVYPFCLLLFISEIFQRDFLLRLKSQVISPFVIAFVLFFIVHLIGMIWTMDVEAGLDSLGRLIPYLFFGIFWVAAKYEHQESYINSFLAGLFLCSILAHYNYLYFLFPEILPEGILSGKRDGMETAPFLSHVMYSPILAVGVYLVLRQLLIPTDIFRLDVFVMRIIMFLALISNLLISTGRAGFLLFLILFICLMIESSKSLGRGVIKILLIVPAACFLAYQIPDVQVRILAGVNDILIFDKDVYSSLGLRYVFSVHAYEMFLANPFFGVGTGDFIQEYPNYVFSSYANLPYTNNPHNQYFMILATLGLFGAIIMFNLLIKCFQYGDYRARSILLGFMVISFFESYLWRSNTTMMFMFFMAIFCQRRSFLFASIK